MAALAAAALWTRAGRVALAVTPLVSIGLIVAVYVVRQVQRAYPPGVEWPAAHFPSNQLGLIAVLAVVADAAVRGGRRYLSQRATKASPDSQSSTGAAVTR